MYWWYDRAVPRSELGLARGPLPDNIGLAMPHRLSAAERFPRAERLGSQEVVGGAGERAPVGANAPGPGPSAPTSGGRGFSLPLGIPSGVVTAVIGVGLRAAGVPGIVASIVNAIIGPAIRSASAAIPRDVTPGGAGLLSPEDIDQLSRSAEETRGPSAGGPLAAPESVPTPGGDDGLPSGLNTETLDVYGDRQPSSVDVPGESFPGGDGWSPF